MRLYSEDLTLIRRSLNTHEKQLAKGSRAAYAGEIEHIRELIEMLKKVKAPDGPRTPSRQPRTKRVDGSFK